MTRFKPFLAAAAVALSCSAFALPALAHDGVAVKDPYARVSTMMSKSGAAFMVIENHSGTDDRLIKATSDVADRVELHTHKADANGVMQMIEVEEGFPIPAHGSHALARGGDHVMFLGLRQSLKDGDVVKVTLTFEKAGDVAVEIPVDTQRADPAPMGNMQMNGMDHQHMHGASN
ncbi:MAG: copper chaperone PCu(A)C [Sphingomonadales bacterium]|nr:copper chaperone PCu(A)C [Sphingomonadales bacterium]